MSSKEASGAKTILRSSSKVRIASTSSATSEASTSGSADDDALPPNWSKIASKKRPGLFYYYNSETRESLWKHPTRSATLEKEEKIIRSKLDPKQVPKKSPSQKVTQLKNDTRFKKTNIAKNRMEALQKRLEAERKQQAEKNSLKTKETIIPPKIAPMKKVCEDNSSIGKVSAKLVATKSDKIASKNNLTCKQPPKVISQRRDKLDPLASTKPKLREATTLSKQFKIPKKPSSLPLMLPGIRKLHESERIPAPGSTLKTESIPEIPSKHISIKAPEAAVSLPTSAVLSPNIPTCPPRSHSTPITKTNLQLEPIKSPANDRLSIIREQLAEGISLLPIEGDTEMLDLSDHSEVPSQVMEQMEWEDISEELAIQEVVTIRLTRTAQATLETESTIPEFRLPLFDGIDFRRFFFVVLDTNIFLSHLKGLEGMLSTFPAAAGQPIMLVPYIVLQELDRIKHREQGKPLSAAAAHSIRFLNERLRQRDPRVKGQSTFEASRALIEITNPDDNIVNCCLQVREAIASSSPTTELLLLSNDVNLRNKMLVNGVQAFSYAQLLTEAHRIRLAAEDAAKPATPVGSPRDVR